MFHRRIPVELEEEQQNMASPIVVVPRVLQQQTHQDLTLEMPKIFLLSSLVPPVLLILQGWWVQWGVVQMAGTAIVLLHLVMVYMVVATFRTLQILCICSMGCSRNPTGITKLCPLLRTSFNVLLRSFTKALQEKWRFQGMSPIQMGNQNFLPNTNPQMFHLCVCVFGF